MKCIYISGGARSGKSRHAQKLALSLSSNPVYVATARKWDADFEKRIERHQHDRDNRWTSFEEEKNPAKLPLAGRVVVVDCVTLWLTNFFSDLQYDVSKSLSAFKSALDELLLLDATFIIISNEIGMGLHGEHESGRKFTDLQGWANQYVAARADEAIFMVSGLALKLKG